MSPNLTQAMAKELEGFEVYGATIHFTPEMPLPRHVVEDIVRKRIAELGAA
jgi:hypothetical protein